MFRLTREVRFAVNASDTPADAKVKNGYAGHPPLIGLGHYFAMRISLSGDLDPAVHFLVNIKDIDRVVREHAIAQVTQAARAQTTCPNRLIAQLFNALKNA